MNSPKDRCAESRERITNLLLDREEERKSIIQKRKDIKGLNSAVNEQINYFRDEFDQKKKEIDEALSNVPNINVELLPNHFDYILKQINLLQKYVSASTFFLKEYDVRRCQEILHDLTAKTKELEDNYLPKKKFGFKNKKSSRKPVIADEKPMRHSPVDQTDNRTFSNNEIPKLKSQYFETYENRDFCGFQSLMNEKLKLEGDAIYQKDVTLINLSNCVVQLLGAPSTLHLNNLNACIVVCGPVSTSVFIENCINCKFVVACQQLRVHETKRCDIYLHVISRAIIENSTAIKFAPYNFSYENMGSDFEKSGLDVKVNNWNCVDDFNWLASDKSPNWEILDVDNQIENWNKYLE